MKYTIIIPSYNQAPYLPEAIESALSQTIPAEVIVVDDGSTDGSLEIAKKYPVKVISQVNKGLASARNTALMNATGEWIVPLDADDILEENYLETIDKYTDEVDIIAPSFKCFGVSNAVVGLQPGLYEGKELVHDFKEGNKFGYFSAYKREKALEIGGYSPRMVWGYEDYHFWFDLLKRGAKARIISDVLVLYRTKERSMIHEAQERHHELMAQIIHDHKEVYES